ncbi:hypothetical protein Taro_012709 [Colocasia esculenta]|uniref:Uncharacterized protein n=1 Tax=Colocasia esculenta TaxID=4460 RepID=A0A843U9J2_COLES|nr:hypothetical protein [Colocasia esculenta]
MPPAGVNFISFAGASWAAGITPRKYGEPTTAEKSPSPKHIGVARNPWQGQYIALLEVKTEQTLDFSRERLGRFQKFFRSWWSPYIGIWVRGGHPTGQHLHRVTSPPGNISTKGNPTGGKTPPVGPTSGVLLRWGPAGPGGVPVGFGGPHRWASPYRFRIKDLRVIVIRGSK